MPCWNIKEKSLLVKSIEGYENDCTVRVPTGRTNEQRNERCNIRCCIEGRHTKLQVAIRSENRSGETEKREGEVIVEEEEEGIINVPIGGRRHKAARMANVPTR